MITTLIQNSEFRIHNYDYYFNSEFRIQNSEFRIMITDIVQGLKHKSKSSMFNVQSSKENEFKG